MTKGRKVAPKPAKKKGKKTRKEIISESESSSSIFTFDNDSSESFLPVEEEPTEEILNISDILNLSEDYLEEEETAYSDLEQYPLDIDFFAEFGDLPNIEDISEDISVVSKISTPESVPDRGYFVNPLTGSILHDDSTEPSTSEPSTEIELFEESSSSILLPAIIVEEEKPAAKEEDLDALLDIQWQPEEPEEEIDFAALAREEEEKMIKNATAQFITDLVNNVVNHAEFLSPDKFLRQNLDKYKLMEELSYQVKYYQREKVDCTFLNRQATQFFRRKSDFRFIMEDKTGMVEREKRKLIEAKQHLNRILEKEKKLLILSKQLHEQLNNQYNNLKKEAKDKSHKFENHVRKCLHREDSPKLNENVERMLSLLKAYRQEISRVRFSLILHQHTDQQLSDTVKKLEDLGNGLTMKTYTTLQAENQSLDKKIEERNNELNKLYMRCHKSIHTFAHCKENRHTLIEAVKFQKKTLSDIMEKKRALRERVFSLKLQRLKIHSDMKKLREKGGILDKPALLLDYDETVKIFVEKKKNVDHLKRVMSLIQQKIDKLTELCTEVKYL